MKADVKSSLPPSFSLFTADKMSQCQSPHFSLMCLNDTDFPSNTAGLGYAFQ